MKKRILNYLISKFLKLDFYNCRDLEKINAYVKMRDKTIINMLKHRFTDNFAASWLATTEEERWLLKGKATDCEDLMKCIENSEQMLLDYEKYKERSEQINNYLAPIRDKLINKK